MKLPTNGYIHFFMLISYVFQVWGRLDRAGPESWSSPRSARIRRSLFFSSAKTIRDLIAKPLLPWHFEGKLIGVLPNLVEHHIASPRFGENMLLKITLWLSIYLVSLTIFLPTHSILSNFM